MDLGQTNVPVCLQYIFFPKPLPVVHCDIRFYFIVVWEDDWINLGIS